MSKRRAFGLYLFCSSTEAQRVTIAIDMHVHLPTTGFLDATLKPYTPAAEKFFRAKVPRREMADVARLYQEMDIMGVLLAWDAETATGLPPLTNDEVADVVNAYPQQFIGFAS